MAPLDASTAAGGVSTWLLTTRAARKTRLPTTSTSVSDGTMGAVQPLFGASVERS